MDRGAYREAVMLPINYDREADVAAEGVVGHDRGSEILYKMGTRPGLAAYANGELDEAATDARVDVVVFMK
jgi:hypothetical protein